VGRQSEANRPFKKPQWTDVMTAIQTGDLCEIKQFPNRLWAIMSQAVTEHHSAKRYVCLGFEDDRLRRRIAGSGDLEVVSHPVWETGATVKLSREQTGTVLNDPGDEHPVHVAYVVPRPESLGGAYELRSHFARGVLAILNPA
jgi:hypothetical protein